MGKSLKREKLEELRDFNRRILESGIGDKMGMS
jgi:hypothetical protein